MTDEDCKDKISVVMKTEHPYQIIKGDHIAPLLLLPMSLLGSLVVKELEDLEAQENRCTGKVLYLILDPHYLYVPILSDFQDCRYWS